MPIKPENKHLYPDNWNEISYYIRFVRAENKCENCGVENYSFGYWIDDKFYDLLEISEHLHKTGEDLTDGIPLDQKPIRIVLTTAHLDHDPTNNDFDNLKALCQRCHNRHDIKHRVQTRKKAKYKGMESLF